MSRPALVATADGEVFAGEAVGAEGIATGEAVFNTSMTGYQEILTDPSYAGQVVVMTNPHIGNYGVAQPDSQSAGPAVAGFVMRSLARRHSSWRAHAGLDEFLAESGIVAVSEIDTRRLTRHVRDRGAMPVALGSGVGKDELVEAANSVPSMVGRDLASLVTTPIPYHLDAGGPSRGKLVAVDLGMKTDILRNMTTRGWEVDVVPAGTGARDILDARPDGVFLSNGPGDPEPLRAVIATVAELIGQVPIFGICLGHQVLGLALGASTYKLRFGHHGGNHPVKRLGDGRVEITAQNHGFAVDLWSLTEGSPPPRQGLVGVDLLPERVETARGWLKPTHQNLNDGTLEGMALDEAPVFSVQYHPEAAPGPSDARGLFDEFTAMIEEER